ncbi:G6PD, partial [Symbiodinium necroappetens]
MHAYLLLQLVDATVVFWPGAEEIGLPVAISVVLCKGEVSAVSISELAVAAQRYSSDEADLGCINLKSKRPPVARAYEKLIHDVIQGESHNFVRRDELEQAWRIFDPLLTTLEKEEMREPERYTLGSRGPFKADMLIDRMGFRRYTVTGVPGFAEDDFDRSLQKPKLKVDWKILEESSIRWPAGPALPPAVTIGRHVAADEPSPPQPTAVLFERCDLAPKLEQGSRQKFMFSNLDHRLRLANLVGAPLDVSVSILCLQPAETAPEGQRALVISLYMAPTASDASEWAEKRRAKVEAAKAKKAEREQGEVTSDHTFKPKTRSGKLRASLSGSGKVTPVAKSDLTSPVLRRRPGDAVALAMPEMPEASSSLQAPTSERRLTDSTPEKMLPAPPKAQPDRSGQSARLTSLTRRSEGDPRPAPPPKSSGARAKKAPARPKAEGVARAFAKSSSSSSKPLAGSSRTSQQGSRAVASHSKAEVRDLTPRSDVPSWPETPGSSVSSPHAEGSFCWRDMAAGLGTLHA